MWFITEKVQVESKCWPLVIVVVSLYVSRDFEHELQLMKTERLAMENELPLRLFLFFFLLAAATGIVVVVVSTSFGK